MAEHTHIDADGNVYTHDHDHPHDHDHSHDHVHFHDHEHGQEHDHHGHGHTHTHEHQQAVIHRLARAAGHLNAVKRMVEDNRDCSDVLIQIAAVQSALNAVSRIILKDHIEHCIVDAIETNDTEAITQLERAIDQLLK